MGKKGCGCAEKGDKILTKVCKILGPKCKEIQAQFRRGEITPREAMDKLNNDYTPKQVKEAIKKATE